jgi:hypothetical protein
MIESNQRVSESRKRLDPLPLEIIQKMCDCLIQELGNGEDDIEKKALKALENKDYDEAKRLCLCDPCNHYLSAISCIASAYRSPMIADSVLRDAARHTSNVAKTKAEKRLSKCFFSILN